MPASAQFRSSAAFFASNSSRKPNGKSVRSPGATPSPSALGTCQSRRDWPVSYRSAPPIGRWPAAVVHLRAAETGGARSRFATGRPSQGPDSLQCPTSWPLVPRSDHHCVGTRDHNVPLRMRGSDGTVCHRGRRIAPRGRPPEVATAVAGIRDALRLSCRGTHPDARPRPTRIKYEIVFSMLGIQAYQWTFVPAHPGTTLPPDRRAPPPCQSVKPKQISNVAVY